jgi:hypothetical protein
MAEQSSNQGQGDQSGINTPPAADPKTSVVIPREQRSDQTGSTSPPAADPKTSVVIPQEQKDIGDYQTKAIRNPERK